MNLKTKYIGQIKTTLMIASIAIFYGSATPAHAQTPLFSTDFENHVSGPDNLAGTDSWGTNAVNSGVQGIEEIRGNQYGYLGGAFPSTDFIEVYQSTPYDPVAQGEPIVNISMDVAVFDSINLEYDSFYIDIYNQDIALLGSIVFDNASLGILSWDSVNELVDTGVDFANGTFQQLAFSINFATNRWSATYGSDTLFTNEVFYAGDGMLDYDSIAFTWIVADLNAPGDNFIAFDNIEISAATPEPSTYALLAGVVCLGGVLLRRRK